MEVHLQQRLEQRMHLSQQMLQNLELLQLPIMDLRELIMNELQENPTLEEKQDVEEPETAEPEAPAETPEEEAIRESLEDVEEQWMLMERTTRRSDSAEQAEKRMEMMQNLAAETTTLREHLSLQLSLLEIPEDMRVLCEHVIQNINEHGLLAAGTEDMVNSVPDDLRHEEPEVLAQRLEHAIAIIQSLEPRGVGGRSIRECLLLQIDETDPVAPLLRKVIEHHFEDVASNRLPKIARALAADPEAAAMLGYTGEPDPELLMEDVKTLLAEISKLNPRPGAHFSSTRAPKVYPEVVIKRVDGRYEIMLEDGWLPPISVNRNYEEMLQERRLTKKDRERISAVASREDLPEGLREFLSDLSRGRRFTPDQRDTFAEKLRIAPLDPEDRKFLEQRLEERKLSRDDRDFLKRKMDAGRKLITAIEQRRGTIYRITNEILKHQIDFFEQGIDHLKPLKMQDVADVLGIHLSTVSRAISEKWVETPRGIFPLKFFFASAAPRRTPGNGLPGAFPPLPGEAAAEDKTRLALMEKIREIVAAEDKKDPLSDLAIVRKLKDMGVSAARRTIAKYREEMNIPSSRLRKEY